MYAKLFFVIPVLAILTACTPADYATLKERVAQLESERKSYAEERRRLGDEKTRFEAEKLRLYREISDLKARIPKEDFGYLLIKKEYIPGAIRETGKYNELTKRRETERVDPQHLLFFKGVHTDTMYPAIPVRESAYQSFTEGAVYRREDLTDARKK